MKEIIKTFETKLKPNSKQKLELFKIFNAQRFLFNNLLYKVKNFHFGTYKKDPSKPNVPSRFDLIKEVTKIKNEFNWLYECPNDYLQATATNLSRAFDGFYRKGGYPKYKKKKDFYQTVNNYTGVYIKIQPSKLLIPKMKEPIKFVQHFEFPEEYKITGYTISKDSVGDYWLALTIKYFVEEKAHEVLNPVGCDLGLKETLITSNNEVFKRKRTTLEFSKKLTKLQRRLSKKKTGSKNKDKARIKVAKLHRKIANIRKHNNHNISRSLVNNYNCIIMESLKVKNMIKNRKLSKSIQDVAWGQLVSMIKYKQNENQGLFHQIDTFYPSSKTCSNCGSIKKDLTLKDRTYSCSCGLVLDRDLNAAINILNKGLDDLKIKRATEE